MENVTYKKTENQMLAEMHALREMLVEEKRRIQSRILGRWTEKILAEAAYA